jgi:hypothetical protein
LDVFDSENAIIKSCQISKIKSLATENLCWSTCPVVNHILFLLNHTDQINEQCPIKYRYTSDFFKQLFMRYFEFVGQFISHCRKCLPAQHPLLDCLSSSLFFPYLLRFSDMDRAKVLFECVLLERAKENKKGKYQFTESFKNAFQDICKVFMRNWLANGMLPKPDAFQLALVSMEFFSIDRIEQAFPVSWNELDSKPDPWQMCDIFIFHIHSILLFSEQHYICSPQIIPVHRRKDLYEKILTRSVPLEMVELANSNCPGYLKQCFIQEKKVRVSQIQKSFMSTIFLFP